MKFATDPAFWLATGGAISGVRYAVIWKDSTSAPARKLLTDGHTLSVVSTTGVFQLR
jgi:hypothetical protein